MRLQSKHIRKFSSFKNSKTYKKCLQSVETRYLDSTLPEVNEKELKIRECSRIFKNDEGAFLSPPQKKVILGYVLFDQKPAALQTIECKTQMLMC